MDSLEFPGQKHTWILTQLLIKGKEKSYNTMLDNLANCLYLIGKWRGTESKLNALMSTFAYKQSQKHGFVDQSGTILSFSYDFDQ